MDEQLQLELTFTFDDARVANYVREHGVKVDVHFRAKRAPKRGENDNAPALATTRHFPTADGPFGYDGSYDDE